MLDQTHRDVPTQGQANPGERTASLPRPDGSSVRYTVRGNGPVPALFVEPPEAIEMIELAAGYAEDFAAICEMVGMPQEAHANLPAWTEGIVERNMMGRLALAT